MTNDDLMILCDSQRGDPKTRSAKVAFLKTLALNGGVIIDAARAAGFSNRTAHNWKKDCAVFADAIEKVKQAAEQRPVGDSKALKPVEPLRTKRAPEIDEITPDYRKQIENICKDVTEGQRRTIKAQRKFLKSLYANNGNQTAAIRQIGKAPRTLEYWKSRDSNFASLVQQVQQIIQAELTGVIIDEFKSGNAKAFPLVARGLLGWNDDSKTQVNVTNQLVNPDRSHAEKIARAREVMDAIGYSVVDTEKPKIEQIN